MNNKLIFWKKENKKFDWASLRKEAFFLSFIFLGFFLLLIVLVVDFWPDVPWDSQTIFLMAVTCFGTYVYLMNIYYSDTNERNEIIKAHISFIFIIFFGFFIILFFNYLYYVLFKEEILNYFEFLRFGLDLDISELEPYKFLIFFVLSIYFFFYFVTMYYLGLFDNQRFWKEELVNESNENMNDVDNNDNDNNNENEDED